MPIVLHDVVRIHIARVREAPWNANKVSKKTLAKIRTSLERYGSVENSVVRPGWCVGARTVAEIAERRAAQLADPEFFETLSGNHRLQLYREGGVEGVPCVVVEEPDPSAKVLAQVLNRTRGVTDDVDKLKALLVDALADLQRVEITSLLPHTERDLLKLLEPPESKDDDLPDDRGTPPDSTPGAIYWLGPHRLLCGDSTDRAAVESFIGRDIPLLMATDPPYAVKLDQGWRDGAGMERDGAATANADEIEGDDGFAWESALAIVPVTVAYVWHADKFTAETLGMLERAGFERRALIVWNKDAAVIGRSHYHWKHELAWYAVRRGRTTPWYGGRNQTTVWEAKSPRQLLGANTTGDDARLAHPTQKPVAIFEPPVVNHLAVGEFAYDPFAGSGTLLAACAKTGRRALLVEKSPKYCDLIRRRWTKWAAAHAQDAGPGGLE